VTDARNEDRWDENIGATKIPLIPGEWPASAFHFPEVSSAGMFRLSSPPGQPRCQTGRQALYVNAAHNDYLQVLVETGILGFACVLWFISVLYRNGAKDFRHWNQSWRGALQLSALVGCTGLLVHSALDFNLQVPGNAAFFYAFCALATSLRSNAERLTSSLVDVPLRKVS